MPDDKTGNQIIKCSQLQLQPHATDVQIPAVIQSNSPPYKLYSSAKLLFKRNIKTTLPEIQICPADEEMR